RKLGKHMERKRRKEEKTSPILILIIKIRLVFFLRVDYCPTLFLLYSAAVQIDSSLFQNICHLFIKKTLRNKNGCSLYFSCVTIVSKE
ncbi:hypothetical protein, partial [Enterococcus larvae]|uniref:hypothetical protein n=1 Tax=Enterococcus larvae TaxID=2794352 RepID=UPI001FD7BDC1